MIPRVIHQMWIGPKARPHQLMSSWRAMNPRYRYELWDDARCAKFGFQNQAKIDAQPEWNGKCDIMRYEILERMGGLFFDADTRCLRPLEDELLSGECWTCYESEKARPGLLACGYMGATIGCKLMGMCTEEIAKRDMAAGRAWETVGPMLLTHVAKGYVGLKIYPSYLFIPQHFTGLKQTGPRPPYAAQFWGSTTSYEGLSK